MAKAYTWADFGPYLGPRPSEEELKEKIIKGEYTPPPANDPCRRLREILATDGMGIESMMYYYYVLGLTDEDEVLYMCRGKTDDDFAWTPHRYEAQSFRNDWAANLAKAYYAPQWKGQNIEEVAVIESKMFKQRTENIRICDEIPLPPEEWEEHFTPRGRFIPLHEKEERNKIKLL